MIKPSYREVTFEYTSLLHTSKQPLFMFESLLPGINLSISVESSQNDGCAAWEHALIGTDSTRRWLNIDIVVKMPINNSINGSVWPNNKLSCISTLNYIPNGQLLCWILWAATSKTSSNIMRYLLPFCWNIFFIDQSVDLLVSLKAFPINVK